MHLTHKRKCDIIVSDSNANESIMAIPDKADRRYLCGIA